LMLRSRSAKCQEARVRAVGAVAPANGFVGGFPDLQFGSNLFPIKRQASLSGPAFCVIRSFYCHTFFITIQ